MQRKVKFPTEFDALDLATDDLKTKLLPASRKLQEIEKERAERRKVRKRTKAVVTSTTKNAPVPAVAETAATAEGDVAMADVSVSAGGGDSAKVIAAGELEDENVYREREARELGELVDDGIRQDIGASQTGLYDLVGLYRFI